MHPEKKALRIFIETRWPSDKASVPILVHPYWSVRHELTMHERLLFKPDRVVIPSSLLRLDQTFFTSFM